MWIVFLIKAKKKIRKVNVIRSLLVMLHLVVQAQSQLYRPPPSRCSGSANKTCVAKPKDRGWSLPWWQFFSGSQKTKRPCIGTLVHVKDPQVFEINPEPSTAVRLMVQVQLRHVYRRIWIQHSKSWIPCNWLVLSCHAVFMPTYPKVCYPGAF